MRGGMKMLKRNQLSSYSVWAGMRSHSVASDSAAPQTAACQFPLSMVSSWQDNWSGLPFPLPGGLPDSGIKLAAPAAPDAPTLAGRFFITELPGKPLI